MESFVPVVHNQRFHNKECCRIHTNERILAQYHAKKQKVNKDRICAHKGCITILSRYNSDIYCGSHQHEHYLTKLSDWGWTVDEDNY